MHKPSASLSALLLPLLLAACQDQAPAGFSGYIEGDYLYLAAPQAGYLQTLAVARGQRAAAGVALFAVGADPDTAVLAEAEARVGAAREKLQNLQEPRRTPEIAALEATLRAAEAAQKLTQVRLKRQQELAAARFVSSSALDEAKSADDQAKAQVEATRQQLKTLRETLGRPPEVRGAAADLQAAEAVSAQKRWSLTHKNVSAPAAGEVADTYFRPGEWVAAGSAVLSFLPDERRRLRFFVPQARIGELHPGSKVVATCDGCAAAIEASVDFIAPNAEYTPPVIYSRESREKLVFRVEAVPAAGKMPLHPGLPIDVRLIADAGKH